MLVARDTCEDSVCYQIAIPDFMASPWAGCYIELIPVADLALRLVRASGVSQLGAQCFTALGVPRVRQDNGEYRNIWSYDWLVRHSDALDSMFSPLDTHDQAQALDLLLGATIRIGGEACEISSTSGVKLARPLCARCHQKMTFIAQLAASWLPNSVDFDVHNSEIYLFGCANHLEQLDKVVL